jgi:tetratricopeptide (TPR) repeat protein
VLGDSIDNMGTHRRLVAVVAGALMLASCGGGGNLAPVAERSTAGAQSGANAGSSDAARARAGFEVGEGDWTATVRPLGDSSPTTTRALSASDPDDPGESASAARTVAVAPAAAQATAASGSTTVNPAVVSLLNTASAQSRAGNHAKAAATLERAIAIEPDNAWLWHRLAATRLAEGRLEQAAGLAAKSSSLRSADRSLQADNWKLIAEVRRRQGDAGAAAAAEAQARKLAY